MLQLIATCALGLEELLAAELAGLGVAEIARQRGAVSFRGGWRDCWLANWRLRTANRILVRLGTWNGHDGEGLRAGARNLVRRRPKGRQDLDVGRLLSPSRTLAVRATATASRLTDVRWVALATKDGLVDGQRDRHGRRSSVDRREPDVSLRLRLHRDQATLLLDTSGEPLDRRGYREVSVQAPLREQLAAACVLAAGWDGEGPVVDPMCGSGTLLAEAGWIALGRAPGALRRGWAFERLPGFDRDAFAAVRAEPLPAPGPQVRLIGVDRAPDALHATAANLERAGLGDRAELVRDDAFTFEPPAGPGLLVLNPAWGERLAEQPEQWKRLGDLLKQRFAGWRAVVLAGDSGRGKHVGLKPSRRIPVLNGPIEARILVFDLY